MLSIAKIEALSHPEPTTGCWLWVGQVHASRTFEYGRIQVAGKRWRAHRYSLSCRIGRRVRCDRVVRHLCDTPLCVNPHHLAEGTQRQNCLDQKRNRKAAWPC
jgi:hypothetical protein